MKLNIKRTIRYFLKHIGQYKALSAIIWVSLILGVGIQLYIPYYYKVFFDKISTATDPKSVAGFLTGIVILIMIAELVRWLFGRITQFSVVFFNTRIMTNIAQDCFNYMHKHSYKFFTNSFAGSLVRRINRLVWSFDTIMDRINYDLLPLILRIIVIFVVLLFINPIISFIVLGWIALFITSNYIFIRYKWKYDIERAKSESRTTGELTDTITNNINIKLFGTSEHEESRFAEVLAELQQKTRKSWILSSYAESIQILAMILLEMAILYTTVILWKDNLLTVGDFVWIQAYLLEIFRSLWNFGRVIRDLFKNFADADEMVEIMHKKHEIKDIRGAKTLSISRGKIEFKNINFSYNKETSVIKNLSLKIKPGEKIALVGPSGGGKTTVTKLILRLFDIQKGQILIDNQNIKKVTQKSLRSNISLVPQDPILFHRTLKENIRYGNINASDQEIIGASKLAYCHDFIMALPNKYNSYVGERGIKLSGGERQRIAIARAILSNNPILILDEATSSLDSYSEQLIQKALMNLMKNKTTLIIAHRLSTIMQADRILVFQNGNIVEEGTHGDLISQKSGLYKKLWDLQVGGYVGK